VPNCLVCVIDDDLSQSPSPMKYVPVYADIMLELTFCPNKPVSYSDFQFALGCAMILENKVSSWYTLHRILGRSTLFSTLVLKVVLSLLLAVTMMSSSSIDGGATSGSALQALSVISLDSRIRASLFSMRRLDHLVTAVFSSMYLLVGSSSLSGSSPASAFT
jgi:hypothetical protein